MSALVPVPRLMTPLEYVGDLVGHPLIEDALGLALAIVFEELAFGVLHPQHRRGRVAQAVGGEDPVGRRHVERKDLLGAERIARLVYSGLATQAELMPSRLASSTTSGTPTSLMTWA